jgi:C_GCAxxG_C_C family probable redox protein
MGQTNRPESAADIMRGGLNCAQAVAKAYAAEMGLDEKTATRLMAGFGAGLGRNGLVCGAVSGAALVLGMKFGNAEAADAAAREKTNAAVCELVDGFRGMHGSVLCRELTQVDMRDPEQLKRARERGVFSTACPAFVRSAAELLDEMLAED